MTDNIQQAAEALLQTLNTPVPDPAPGNPPAGGDPAPVTKYGEVEAPTFWAALGEYSKGEIKDESSFQSYIQRAKEYETVVPKMRELEAKSAVDPFASPIVKKINEMAQANASLDEIHKFVDLQRFDVNSLNDLDAYRKYVAYKYPGLNEEEVDATIKRDGIDPEQMSDPSVSSLVKVKAMEARAFFAQQKVATSNPEALQQRQAEEQMTNNLRGAWTPVIDRVVSALSDQVKADVEGMTVDFQYQFSEQARKLAQQEAIRFLLAQKAQPTQENLQSAIEYAKFVAFAADAPNYKKALIESVAKKAKLDALVAAGGNPPKPPGGNPLNSGEPAKPSRPKFELTQ